MKIVVQILSYKSPWAKMFLWLTSGVSPAARTWLIATAISVGLKGSKGCADWDLYCTGDPADSSQVSKNPKISVKFYKCTHISIRSKKPILLPSKKRKTERQTTPMLPPDMNYSVASFLSWLSLYRILIRTLQGLEGPRRFFPLFKDEHHDHAWTSQPTPISPKSKPLSSYTVDWKYLVHPDTFTTVGWMIGGDQVLGRSPTWVLFGSLGGLTSEFSWDSREGLGLNSPSF